MTRIQSMLWAALAAVMAAASGASGQLRVLTDQAACAPGGRLILPIRFDGDADPRAPVQAWLADGRSVIAEVYRLETTPVAGPISPIEAWVGRPTHWRADHVDRVDPRLFEGSVWVLVVRLPDDASGSMLRVGDELIRMAWLTGQPTSASDRGDGALRWRAALHDVSGLARLSSTQRADPMLGWRTEVLDEGGPTEPAPDPIITALTAQQTALWRVGLDRLWEHDEALTGSLVRALWATVRFADATRVPIWTSDPARLDELLWTLVDEGLDDRTRARRVRSWIADEPRAVAWVIDDAGRYPSVRIGAANLTTEPMLAWAGPLAETTPPEPTRVPPGVAIELDAMPHTADMVAGAWELRLGRMSVQRQIVPGRVALVPPGLTIGPLLADWTLDDWTHSVVAPTPDRSRLTAARLMWIADDLDIPADDRLGVVIHREAQQGGHLALFIECAWSGARADDDIVRVWIGPAGAPRAVLRVSRSGSMSNELNRMAPTPLAASVQKDRWSALVPIPVGVLDGDGTLRLGIERIDPSGQRSAWPRRMLPWQREPGRIRIDPGQWNGLAASDDG